MKTTAWIVADGGAFRALAGTNGSRVEDRVAFIEKTPRVRVRNEVYGSNFPDWLNWAEGTKGEGPEDEQSRDWCDRMLELLGYQLG
jgi:hypothetical protein